MYLVDFPGRREVHGVVIACHVLRCVHYTNSLGEVNTVSVCFSIFLPNGDPPFLLQVRVATEVGEVACSGHREFVHLYLVVIATPVNMGHLGGFCLQYVSARQLSACERCKFVESDGACSVHYDANKFFIASLGQNYLRVIFLHHISRDT